MQPRFLSSMSFCKSLHTLRLQDQVKLLASGGNLEEALFLLSGSTSASPGGGPPVDVQTYAALFRSCARASSLHHGIAFHRLLLLSQNSADLSFLPRDHRLFLTNHLISMYAKCGDLVYARTLFDEMSHRNHVSWTALISGYAQHGRGDDCFLIFSAMLSHFRPNEFAFTSVLSSCVHSAGGKQRGKQGFSSRDLEATLLTCSFKCTKVGSGLTVLLFLASCQPCLLEPLQKERIQFVLV